MKLQVYRFSSLLKKKTQNIVKSLLLFGEKYYFVKHTQTVILKTKNKLFAINELLFTPKFATQSICINMI